MPFTHWAQENYWFVGCIRLCRSFQPYIFYFCRNFVHVSMIRDGVLTRPSNRIWQRDAELGANTLTIANGHTVDAMRFVTGDFSRLSAVVATQAKQWLDTGANTLLDVTAPDNIIISGWLANGAVVSSHVGHIPFAGSGYRMEIYGRAGTLVASGEDSPQLGEVFR